MRTTDPQRLPLRRTPHDGLAPVGLPPGKVCLDRGQSMTARAETAALLAWVTWLARKGSADLVSVCQRAQAHRN